MKSIRKCPKCGEYSLKEECPKCKGQTKTESCHPPAYSFEKEKKFARFRRKEA